MKLRLSVLCLFFGGIVSYTYGYSSGAPETEEICRTMIPKHPSSPATTHLPYSIIVDKTRIGPGEKVNLSLRTTTRTQLFRGFLVQGRRVNYERDTSPVGNFLPDDNDGFNTLNCGGNKHTSLTHSDAEPKTVVELTWTAPRERGTYVLLSTFVLDGKTYWVKNPSTNITVA